MINAQNEKVKQLLSSVKDALLGFSSDELDRSRKGWKGVWAMSDKLLFQSGSARLINVARKLGKLAEVLNKQLTSTYLLKATLTINRSTRYSSKTTGICVIRATSVVRILIKNYGVNFADTAQRSR